MSGALKTLVTMLASAQSLAGASVLFGEENINAQDAAFPMIVVVPQSGIWNDPTGLPGYYEDGDVDVNMIWMTRESINIYIAAFSGDAQAQPVDHADAVEVARQQVLQALQTQAPNGLKYVPMAGRWEQMQQASIRYGRAYVLTVQVDITVTDVLPVTATVEEVTLSPVAFT